MVSVRSSFFSVTSRRRTVLSNRPAGLALPQADHFLIGPVDEHRDRVAVADHGADQRQRGWFRRSRHRRRSANLFDGRRGHRARRRASRGRKNRALLRRGQRRKRNRPQRIAARRRLWRVASRPGDRLDAAKVDVSVSCARSLVRMSGLKDVAASSSGDVAANITPPESRARPTMLRQPTISTCPPAAVLHRAAGRIDLQPSGNEPAYQLGAFPQALASSSTT